jgi:hypothetical protein
MWYAITFAVCGVLSYLMLKDTPQRFPKVAVILAAVSGGGFAGWGRDLLTHSLTWINSVGVRIVGTSILVLIFVALLWKVVNGLTPKVGKVAAGSVTPAYAAMAFLIPIVAAMAGGKLAAMVLGLIDSGGQAVASLTAGWL